MESFQESQRRLCSAFKVADVASLQDVLNCMLLSESAYKAYEAGPGAVRDSFNRNCASFARGLLTVDKIQCSLPHVQHRYLLATSDEAIHVALMGTKALRDILTDVNYVQTTLWPGLESVGVPTAHQGFLARSQTVPVELLYAHAVRERKRLIFCGHSLGGAVAKLCTLRLLRQLPAESARQGRVRCICFSAPPLGNAALADAIAREGWSHLFYNLSLPEDIVPRLMAMRYSVSLPTAAVEAMSEEASGEARSANSTDKVDNGRFGGHTTQTPQSPGMQQGGSGAVTNGLPGEAIGPYQSRQNVQPAWLDSEEQDTKSKGKSPVQPWRAKLTSSLEKLRALAADSRAPTSPDRFSSTQHLAESEPQSRPATPEGISEPGNSSSVKVGAGNLQLFASTAARYLPVFVQVGTQVQLQSPQTAMPAAVTAKQQPGQQAAAALSQTSQAAPQSSGHADATHSTQSPALAGESIPSQQKTADGLREGSERDETANASAESAAARRLFMDRLYYHRMFALRDRAAAICADVEGAAWGGGDRSGCDSGSIGIGQASLCDDIAPPLRVLHARALLPPLKPAAQPATPATARSAATLGSLATLSRAFRAVNPFWSARQPNIGTMDASSPGVRTCPAASNSMAGEGAFGSQGAVQAQASHPQQQQQEGFTVGQRSWLSWPWISSSALPQEEAQGTGQTRQWLGWGPGGNRGGAEQQQQHQQPPPTVSSGRSVRLEIRLSGQGLGSCTSVRLRLRNGRVCPARITCSPRLPSLQSFAGEPAGSADDATLAAAQLARQDYLSILRSTARRLLASARQAAGAPRQGIGPEGEQPEEEMVVEAVLPAAAADNVVNRRLGDEHSSPIELLTRSDFHVRRTQVQLQPCTVWVLSDSGRGARLIMGSLCGQPQQLPGTASEAGHAFQEAYFGNVRCLSLLPDRSAAGMFPVTAQMVARLLQRRGAVRNTPQSDAETGLQEDGRGGSAPGEGTQRSHHAEGGQQHAQDSVLHSGLKGAAGTTGQGPAAISGIPQQLWMAGAALRVGVVASLEAGFRWAAQARQRAGSRTTELRSGLGRLRHRRLWQQLQQQNSPRLLVICINDLPRRKSPPVRNRNGTRLADEAARSSREGAVDVPSTSLSGNESWEADAGGTQGAAAAKALLQAAHLSGIPAVIVALSDNAADLPGRHVGQSAGHVITLMIKSSTDGLSETDAWRVQMAVYRSLSTASEWPVFQSKL